MNPLKRYHFQLTFPLLKSNRHVKQIDDNEEAFRKRCDYYYKLAENNKRGFKVTKAFRYQVGQHPYSRQDLQFEFAAYHIHQLSPSNILDIGSYRLFILGLLSHYNVTTLDIRARKSILDNENDVTGDAKALAFPDDYYDVVLSLEALPHFRLCRYGDEFDLDADIKAFNEMRRVLSPEVICFLAQPLREPSRLSLSTHEEITVMQ